MIVAGVLVGVAVAVMGVWNADSGSGWNWNHLRINLDSLNSIRARQPGQIQSPVDHDRLPRRARANWCCRCLWAAVSGLARVASSISILIRCGRSLVVMGHVHRGEIVSNDASDLHLVGGSRPPAVALRRRLHNAPLMELIDAPSVGRHSGVRGFTNTASRWQALMRGRRAMRLRNRLRSGESTQSYTLRYNRVTNKGVGNGQKSDCSHEGRRVSQLAAARRNIVGSTAQTRIKYGSLCYVRLRMILTSKWCAENILLSTLFWSILDPTTLQGHNSNIIINPSKKKLLVSYDLRRLVLSTHYQ